MTLTSSHRTSKPASPSGLLPDDFRHKAPSPEATAHELNEQLQALLTADQVAALTLARSKLRTLNHLRLDHERRAALNETFLPLFDLLSRQHFDFSGKSSHQATFDEDDGFILFCDELAIAYRLCTLEAERLNAAQQKLGFYNGMALFFHSQAMFQRFVHNIMQPPSAWQVAHQLYASAEKRGLHRFESGSGLNGALKTIHDQYVQLLLVAGANPYSLGQTDTLWVVRFTQRAASATGIVHPDNLDEVISALGVRLDRDEGPLRLRYKPRGSHPGARLLSTHQICQQLETRRQAWLREEQNVAAIGTPPDASRDRVETLLAHLDECWRCQKHRGDSRHQQSRECELLWGLPAIYRWLCNGRQALGRHFSDQVGQLAHARLIEESSSGYRFCAPQAIKAFLNPGELLLVPEASSQETGLSLAILRWVKDMGDGNLLLGAARVEADVRPALLHADSDIAEERIALLLSNRVQSPHHKFILCAADTRVPPGEIGIFLPALSRSSRARLGSTLLSTPFFKVIDTYLKSALR